MVFRMLMLLIGALAFFFPVGAEEAPVQLEVRFPYSLNASKDKPASVGIIMAERCLKCWAVLQGKV